MPTIILQRSPNDTNGKPIDVAVEATNGRFRLVNCEAFLGAPEVLQVEEFSFDDMPKLHYAAISYPWRGVDTDPILPTFHVKGAENADPISTDVVRSACIAAIQGGANYIWLDRLCVLQNRDEKCKPDKKVQIEHMHGVYSHCALCIVIPGGLQRLVSLDEETPWILRSWTLQEALSPKKVVVLVAWTLGSSRNDTVQEVVEKRSATIRLERVINDTSEGFMEFVREGSPDDVDVENPTCFIRTNIFHRRSPHARSLAAALADSKSTSEDFRDNAVWQCSQLRTSSRPVDMVLSIMGMFGVTLTAQYEPGDRLRATIDLAKEILKKGRAASWLAASFRLPPCKYISTFSLFPETQVAGGAMVETPSGSQDISMFVGGLNLSVETITASDCLQFGDKTDSRFRALLKCLLPLGERLVKDDDEAVEPDAKLLPHGSMDDEGYLKIEAVSHPVQPCSQKADIPCLHAVNDTWWEAYGSIDQDNREFDYFAIFLGMYKKYHDRGRYGTFPIPGDGNVGKFMIVKRHDAKLDRFHVVTYCLKWNILTLVKLEWATREFCIGGPELLPNGRMERQVVENEPERLSSDMHLDGVEVADLPGRLKARPQREVEEYFKSRPDADRFPHDGAIKSAWKRGKEIVEEKLTEVSGEIEEAVVDFLDDLVGDTDSESEDEEATEESSNDDDTGSESSLFKGLGDAIGAAMGDWFDSDDDTDSD